jgi:hypothetical protein
VPIEFFQTNDGLVHVRQSFDSPTVYLDHWAIRLFSDDRDLQDRFVKALISKRGTLLLSTFSFAEFSEASDARHCLDAEAFFERLLPNIFLTNSAPDDILERELNEPNNVKRFWPPADLPQLKLFAERKQSAPLGFTMQGFIMMAHTHRTELSEVTKSTVRMVRDGLENVRNDPSYVAKTSKSVPSDNRPRTYIIFGELLRSFNLDSKAPITENDVMDMFHAVMSVNCCDYVLLDGPWMERVERMRQRIAKTSMRMPIAKCFSKRNNGVSAFLADLEGFVKSTQPSAVP